MNIYEQYDTRTIQNVKENAYNSIEEGIDPELIYQTMERLLPNATKEELTVLLFDAIFEHGGVNGVVYN